MNPTTNPQPLRRRIGNLGQATAALAGGAWRRMTTGRRARHSRLGGDTVTWAGRNDGPPDLDELWRDFNRKLSSVFGSKGTTPRGEPDSGEPARPPDMKSAGIGAGLIVLVALVIWAGSGFFIVQEGNQAVVTTFGKYKYTTDAGFQWRFPYPFQSHETVPVTQLRAKEIGRNTVVQATGLRDSLMLTYDENIVDIRFTVQYRLKDARAFLFENREPDAAVEQAAESAVREIIGRSLVDSVLYQQRDAIAPDLTKSIQAQLDRLNAGVLIVNVNVQNVQVPEQVQAAFSDAIKAGADRDRFKNEGQAYASDVIPKARGTAARLFEEAEGYRQRIIAQADGDAQRFRSVLAEYQRAPTVTRDRLYLETMQQVYSNVSKVLIESNNGASLLNLPLDRLLQQATVPATTLNAPTTAPAEAPATGAAADPRSREGVRSRDREGR